MTPQEVFSRRYPRVQVDIAAKQVTRNEGHVAKLVDLSAAGAFLINVHESAFIDGNVVLELHLPGVIGSLWATGKVVRNQVRQGTTGVAIEFTHISEYDKQVIADYVAGQRTGRS